MTQGSGGPTAGGSRTDCSICSTLRDKEYASQKYGWEENDTHLPAAVGQLVLVRDFKPHGSRALQLQVCPECQTYYLYQSDYEYLAGGSEDDQTLTRLTADQAAEYLNRAA